MTNNLPILAFLSNMTSPLPMLPYELNGSYSTPTGLRIQLHLGQVIVNGQAITKPMFSASGISWSEMTPTGHRAGMLRSISNGLGLQGFVTEDGTASLAPVLMTVDALTFSTETCPSPNDPTPTWTQGGPPLTISISFTSGLPVASATIGTIPTTIAVLTPVGAAVPITVAVDEWAVGSTSYQLPEASLITIAFDGQTFSGTMTPWVNDEAGSAIGWRGAAAASVSPHASLVAKDVSDPPLSLADLVSLDTEGSGDVAKQKFQDFIIYSMDDGWRDKLTSAPKPALTAEEVAVVNSNPSFYASNICDPFILQLLSGIATDAGGPSTPISDDDRLKLRYFFQNSLAKLDGYNDQSARLTQLAYEAVAPGITDYINDTSTNWAETLFQAITTPAAIMEAVLAFIGDGLKTTVIDRQTELLLALSPTANQTIGGDANAQPCTYATLYHAKAMTALAHVLTLRSEISTPEAQADLQTYLPAWITQLLITLSEDIADPSLDPGQKAQYQQYLDEMHQAIAAAGTVAALANEIATGIIASQGNSILGKINTWLQGNKLAAGLANLFAVAAFAFALFQVIKAFKGWNTLTDEQRAQTVVSAVDLTVKLASAVYGALPESVVEKLVNVDVSDVIDDNLFDGLELGHDYFTDTTERLAGELAEAGEGDTASALAKMLPDATMFMKCFSVLTAAAAVAFSTYKVYEDFAQGGSTTDKILDSLTDAAAVLTLASVVAAATVGECALAALGPFGAAAGVILLIVEMFLPGPKPDRPSDDYMNQVGNTVLSQLAAVPADWVSTHPAPAKAASV